MSVWNKRIFAAVAVPAALLFTASVAQADNQWGSYQWERDGVDPLTITIGDNHSQIDPSLPNWSQIFDSVVADWASSADGGFGGDHFGAVDSGSPEGNVQSYNEAYGDNGWLGLATIWISRGKNKHITRGESKVNDTYVTLEDYYGFDEPIEWQHVMCQEIGHTFGLEHNREGATGGEPDDSCMNDQTRPLRYPFPNVHDTVMYNSEAMYGHDHGGAGGGGKKEPKCHPKFGCPGVAVGHAVWAEHYETDEEMFDAADAVVDVTVRSSSFDRMVGRGQGAVPVTRVVLRVEDTLSGFTRPVIVLEQTRGLGLELHDDPGYVQGDSYTLYLREIGHNTYRTVNPNGRIRN
ncbi:MAG: hypothetical protein ACE10G_05740 [Gemmatimonadales bacterium]